MNKSDFENYVKTRYQQELEWYDRHANVDRMLYQVLQWTAIVLSALTPVLILIGEGPSEWLAVGIAVIVGITTAALKTFKYQENWINYRTTHETLKKEIHFYEAGIQGYDAVKDREAMFVERSEAIISRENTLWVTALQREKQAKPE
jgi:hypothetical protein